MLKFRLAVDVTVTGTHSNFPAYVDLAEMPASFWSTVVNGGGDIRCYSDQALTTELAREVVTCNTSTDTGELWVKVPSMATSTVIYLTVDGTSSEPAAGSTYGRNAVWSDYVGVWHLGEASGNALDSTSNGNDLTDVNTVGAGTGKVGGGRDFVAANSERFTRADNASLSLGDNDLTFTAWVKRDINDTTLVIGGKGWDNATASNREFQMDIRADNNYAEFQLYDTGFKQVHNSTFGAIATGTWYYFAGRHNNAGNTISIRVNTTNSGTTSVGTPQDGAGTFSVGSNDPGDSYWDGIIDELRYRKGLLSDDWLTTEYTNQSAPATFWDITLDVQKMETVQDAFDDNSLDPMWGTFGTGVSETGGSLRMVSQTTSTYSGIDTGSTVFDLTDSYAFVRGEVDIGAFSIESFEFYPLHLTQESANSGLQFLISPFYNEIGAYRVVSGSAFFVATGTYNPNTQKYFRIREDAGTIYWDTSPDGFNWTNFATRSTGTVGFTIDNLRAGAMLGTWQNEASSANAYLNNFNIDQFPPDFNPAITRRRLLMRR